MSENVKLTSDKGSMEARIAARQRPSNEHSTATHHVVHGTGPTKVSHSIHQMNKAHGPLGEGEGGSE
jgi:hypothetical protein